MKKNLMMRIASFLLVAVLISTSAISGTYAKYTTQDAGSDEARVAKWGVELQVFGNLYGETYKDTIVADSSALGEFTVQSLNVADDVVAPGTENTDGFAFSLQGTPEVSGEIIVELEYENIYLNAGTYGLMVEVPENVITAANFDEYSGTGIYTESAGVYSPATGYTPNTTYFTLEDEVSLDANYYPVEYAMIGNGTTVTEYNTDYDTDLYVDTLAEIGKLIGTVVGTPGTSSITDGKTTAKYTSSFTPNQDLQTVVKLGNQEINWKWDFCQQAVECLDGDDACVYCKADTILGLLQTNGNGSVNGTVVKLQADGKTYQAPVAASGAELNDYNLESCFSIDITVTQVD